MKITKNVENKLLLRKEIEATCENTGATPKRSQIQKDLAKNLKAKEELIVVKKISNYFGNSNIVVKASVYESKKALESAEREHMVKRNAVVEEKVEAPAEEKTVEAPTEETKEEAPATEKKEE